MCVFFKEFLLFCDLSLSLSLGAISLSKMASQKDGLCWNFKDLLQPCL